MKKAYDENRKNVAITDDQKSKISEGLKKYFIVNPRPKKEKIIKERKKRIYTKEEKLEKSKKMCGSNNSFYGKKHNEKTKKIISERNKLNIGEKNHFYGKKHTNETKEKISNTLKNKTKKIILCL